MIATSFSGSYFRKEAEMAKKNLKRLWPIVYDALTSYPFVGQDLDALTYYEMLRMIICRLNETIGVVNDIQGDIEQTVQDILNEWLADGTLEEIISETVLGYMKVFYVPEEFGAKGDGITDDTDAFDRACEAMATGDIKILFIPAKTYVIGWTIAIPEGCTVMGTGRDSVIFYSEQNTAYGVGLVNAGNNVTIKNLRLEQEREPGTITLTGTQTGCMSFSTLDETMYGKIDTPSATWQRKNTHGFIAENLYSDNSPYILQTETPTSGLYSITDVYVNNVIAEKSLVSFMSKSGNGYIKNIHYSNINCAYIRCDQGGNNVINGVVSDFICTGMKLAAPGLIAENGIIDASGDIMYNLDHALQFKAGSTIRSVKILGKSDPTLIYAMELHGNEGSYVIDGCEISGFDVLAQRGSDITGDYAQPIKMTNSVIDWNTVATRSMIQLIANGCNIVSHNPKSPVWNDVPRSLTNIDDIFDLPTDPYSSGRFPTSFISEGAVIHVRTMREMPADTTLFSVQSAFRGYIGEEGGRVAVRLSNSDGSKTADAIAEFDSSANLVLKSTGLTLTDYDHFIIDSDMPINSIIW